MNLTPDEIAFLERRRAYLEASDRGTPWPGRQEMEMLSRVVNNLPLRAYDRRALRRRITSLEDRISEEGPPRLLDIREVDILHKVAVAAAVVTA